jgi:hypothetical protein
MIDYQYHTRKGYFQKLNGAILLNGNPVPVYDTFAVNGADYPYIILSTQTAVDDSAKRCQGQEVTMLLDVVTGFTGAVQRLPLDTICNQIYQLINPVDGTNYIDVGPDLQVISTRLLSDTTMEGQNDVWKIVRRLIRFGHKIHEQVTL